MLPSKIRRSLVVASLAACSSIGTESARAEDVINPREELCPNGDFRELVFRHIKKTRRAMGDREECFQEAAELGTLFWWITDRERKAVDRKMVRALAKLIDDDSLLCTTIYVANILGTLGPEARAAVPTLERALHSADLERAKHPPPKFDYHWEWRLDYRLRSALESIDGKKRPLDF